MAVHHWRCVAEFYATDDRDPAEFASWLRVILTQRFPLGVVEGFPDVWDLDDRIEAVRRERLAEKTP